MPTPDKSLTASHNPSASLSGFCLTYCTMTSRTRPIRLAPTQHCLAPASAAHSDHPPRYSPPQHHTPSPSTSSASLQPTTASHAQPIRLIRLAPCLIDERLLLVVECKCHRLLPLASIAMLLKLQTQPGARPGLVGAISACTGDG